LEESLKRSRTKFCVRVLGIKPIWNGPLRWFDVLGENLWVDWRTSCSFSLPISSGSPQQKQTKHFQISRNPALPDRRFLLFSLFPFLFPDLPPFEFGKPRNGVRQAESPKGMEDFCYRRQTTTGTHCQSCRAAFKSCTSDVIWHGEQWQCSRTRSPKRAPSSRFNFYGSPAGISTCELKEVHTNLTKSISPDLKHKLQPISYKKNHKHDLSASYRVEDTDADWRKRNARVY
jgi:hypothetical protein